MDFLQLSPKSRFRSFQAPIQTSVPGPDLRDREGRRGQSKVTLISQIFQYFTLLRPMVVPLRFYNLSRFTFFEINIHLIRYLKKSGFFHFFWLIRYRIKWKESVYCQHRGNSESKEKILPTYDCKVTKNWLHTAPLSGVSSLGIYRMRADSQRVYSVRSSQRSEELKFGEDGL